MAAGRARLPGLRSSQTLSGAGDDSIWRALDRNRKPRFGGVAGGMANGGCLAYRWGLRAP